MPLHCAFILAAGDDSVIRLTREWKKKNPLHKFTNESIESIFSSVVFSAFATRSFYMVHVASVNSFRHSRMFIDSNKE